MSLVFEIISGTALTLRKLGKLLTRVKVRDKGKRGGGEGSEIGQNLHTECENAPLGAD